MHTLSTEFNQGKLLSMFILPIFPLQQDGFHRKFRFLFPLFTAFRCSYCVPSIERNSPEDFPELYRLQNNNLTAL
jgi:hypothetical protein